MDDMLSNWTTARHATQTLRDTLPNMAATLNSLEHTLSWDSYTPTCHLYRDFRTGSSAHGATPSVGKTNVSLGNLVTPHGKDLETQKGKVLVLPPGRVLDSQKGKEQVHLSFPIPSTLGPVLAKRTRNKQDGSAPEIRKTTPLPVKLPRKDILPPAKDLEDDGCYSCPILEETSSDAEAPSAPC